MGWVHSLKAAPELNGAVGVVAGRDKWRTSKNGERRVAVLIGEESPRLCSLRPANLLIADGVADGVEMYR